MQKLHVLVAQNPAELNAPQARFNWLKTLLKNNASAIEKADLLLLPELFLSGYNVGENVTEWSESSDGHYARQIATLCRDYGLAIHYGYAEKADGVIYNAANCFDRQGKRLGGHRKLLLPPGFEADYFTAGNQCQSFDLNGFTVATLICYDAEFPENFRYLATQGVDVILVPTALGAQWGVVAEKMIPTRAFENGVFTCYANQAGNEHGMAYFGGSCIIAPDGRELARAADAPILLSATLDKALVEKAQQCLPYHLDRQKLPWVKCD